jgi:uncharacterized membrane protein
MAGFKPSYLVHGLPGHPLHPPLTDVTIGAYSFATLAAILSKLGVAEHAFAQAWWLALIVALLATVLTALAGFADWLQIEWGSELWKTATWHALVNVTAGALFLVAALAGHGGYVDHAVTTGAFIFTLLGFATLLLGGWLGGAVVFVHGMRVLSLQEEPAAKAAAPYPSDEKVRAEEA